MSSIEYSQFKPTVENLALFAKRWEELDDVTRFTLNILSQRHSDSDEEGTSSTNPKEQKFPDLQDHLPAQPQYPVRNPQPSQPIVPDAMPPSPVHYKV